MKRIATLMLAALLMAAAVPALAETTAKTAKDECLLAAKGCATEVDSIQRQVKKLKGEIQKGTKVYTPEELKTLEMKLKEVNKLIESMGKPGSGR